MASEISFFMERTARLLIIDNYDSFTYNLYHLLAKTYIELEVLNHDDLRLNESFIQTFDGIVISPGPGRPSQAGHLMQLMPIIVQKPVLGVCLGHQALGEYFGARLTYTNELAHGQVRQIFHDKRSLFEGIDSPMDVMRYHSLALDFNFWPKELKITARLKDNTVMAFEHNTKPIFGIQFHPESVGTPLGYRVLDHFLTLITDITGS